MESERIITITNKELGELLMEHKTVGMEITSISKEIQSLDEKRQTLLVDFQKYNDKIKSIIEDETTGELTKYETLLDANTSEDNSDVIDIKVVDRLKFAQEQLDKEIEEKNVVIEEKSLADEAE